MAVRPRLFGGFPAVEFCTIVGRNYLAGARVLAESVRKQLGRDLHVFVLDADESDREEFTAEPFLTWFAADAGFSVAEYRAMALIYDVVEFATAVKPTVLRALVDRYRTSACYLDPDIVVFSDLDDLARMCEHHDVVLTPHCTEPPPLDGNLPDETTLIQSGVYNLGFVAVSARAQPMLDWWAARLARECVIDPAVGRFVDQRWMDLAPSYFDTVIWKDPGCNVAYWNLHERTLSRGRDGVLVNGSPLRFFHFSGYSPLRPTVLSKYVEGQPRTTFAESSVLTRLFREYGNALLDAGYLASTQIPFDFSSTAAGEPIDRYMRAAARTVMLRHDDDPTVARPPDPFDPAQVDAFNAWIHEHDPADRFDLSRYEMRLWDAVPELRVLHRDPDEDPEAYRAYLARYGGGFGAAREHLPPPRPDRLPARDDRPPGVNVVGYLDAEDGVGAVGRQLIDTLKAAGVPHATVVSGATTSSRGASFDHGEKNDFDLTVACINADELPFAVDRLGESFAHRGPTAGIWAWEVEEFPAWMAASEVLVDEVWTYSAHSAAAIAAQVSCPVHVLAPPIRIETPPPLTRAQLQLPEGKLFLFCFDARSVFERKNPLAVIRAFREAFPADSGRQLVVKAVNIDRGGVDLARLREAAAGRRDIQLRTFVEPPDRQAALMAAADVYVSLHRAEGYGLTMAEAMGHGVPTVATAYSGNLEFMDEDNSLLIPAGRVSIPVGLRPYPAGSMWADPDVDAAARAMRRLDADPAFAAALGERGRAAITERHSPEARAAELVQRLAALRSGRRG